MEKEFLPYEQALALKELGFNEPCIGWYNPQVNYKKVTTDRYWAFHLTGEWENFKPSPLYQQAFRWFREKYGLRIRNYVFVNYSGGISEGFEIFKYSKDTIDRVEALTYEEAELECLKKLIEIVKTK